MYKIGVLGDYDSICGYAALGLDIYPVSNTAKAAATLRNLAGGEYAIIYITEQLLVNLQAEVDRYQDARLPAIIPIPGIGGNLGIGMSAMKKSVERAVGSDILFND